MGEYTVHLVGESNYQQAIRACREGDSVELLPETDNRYDSNAVRAADLTGQTLGYIERGHWLQRMLHHEKTACKAEIRHIMGGERGKPSLGVVLTVWTGEDAGRDLRKAKAAPPQPISKPAPAKPRPHTQPESSGVPGLVLLILLAIVAIFALAVISGN